METSLLDGKKLYEMYLGGAKHIAENAEEINKLNVFPVPDGDTGTNMTCTVEGGVAALAALPADATVGEVATAFAKGVMLGARGNSGVILSQIFRGIEKGLAGKQSVTAKELLDAYLYGVKQAYAAVAKPVEGTVLTVFREGVEKLDVEDGTSLEEFYRQHIRTAKDTLAKTQEILPVLKEAGVVDSGGAGYLCIAEGMYAALTGEETTGFVAQAPVQTNSALDMSLFTRDSELTYGYCTEFFLRLQTKKVNPDAFDVQTLVDYLQDVGDSVVAIKDDDLIKVHVHTKTPGDVLAHCQQYGEFLALKIENMSLQHQETIAEKPKKPRKKAAVVAVATGEGLEELFKELGADAIVRGGQTGNPATGDFIKAFDEVNADEIIVLPNNSNIYLAATSAAEMYPQSKVRVLPTKTFQQGYGALAVVTKPIENVDGLYEDMLAAAEDVVSVSVTYAIRDAVVGDTNIAKGDYIGFVGNDLLIDSKDKADCAAQALKRIPDIEEKEILTVFYGEDIEEEDREAFTCKIKKEFPNLEVIEYFGDQAVYCLLICVE